MFHPFPHHVLNYSSQVYSEITNKQSIYFLYYRWKFKFLKYIENAVSHYHWSTIPMKDILYAW
ncbi:hypothetical protein AA11825_1491 [Acetobacter pomorum DSM 11825]|nr:hypothetical protein AA11825_1491 [Acetobacter pomorum DSM 11825]